MCNYMDGAVSQTQTFNINNTARFEIDLNPTFTRLYDVLQNVTHHAEMKDTGYERSSEPLNGTLHIFGQQRLSDTTAPLCVDYNNTRYYTYAVWTDGVNLSRDYAPCIDAAGKPAFYDRVGGNYIYPIGDKAEIVAEFTGTVGTNSVYVTGENEKGEPAYYFGVILNYLFRLDELKRIAGDAMPLHVVEKKIKYYDDATDTAIKPEKENGYKFETLVLDMIRLSESCLPFEVVREREFAPIKNPTGIDSVVSAQALCKGCGIEL
jgi:hypothetical protein